MEETERDISYLFQAIFRTKCTLKIRNESSTAKLSYFKDCFERSKTICGGCGAIRKKDSWQIDTKFNF